MSIFNPYYYAYNPELLAFENAWVNFLKKGQIKDSVIKKEVAESWKRCLKFKLDPLSTTSPELLSPQKRRERVKKNKAVLDVAYPFMKTLYQLVKGSGFCVNIADSEGYILKSIRDKDMLEFCEKTRSFPGANRSEEVSGTTSIALAIIHKKPIQVAGAEHFMQIFQRWTCSAAPILDERKNVIGVLNVAGRYELVHQHTLGMVAATAKAVENEIRIHKINAQLIQNNSQLKATLSAVTDGVVYINKGIITQINSEMSNFLGRDASEVIGRKVYEEIVTSPDLGKILNGDIEGKRHYEIILKGKEKNYNCLLNIQCIYDNNEEEIGKVLIFTRTEEIQMLASKINKHTAYFTFSDIIGESKKMKQCIDLAKKAAEYNSRIVIEGESGTGKEMFAQAIHNRSRRKNNPFLAVDCGAIPRELLESELFGYESGAFTGARKEGKPGKFELANGGTIFLDEIGNMPMEMQVKLLRVLQEEKIIRVGGNQPIPIDVRIIAATNANLEEEVKRGNFREDLFYRLNVFYIRVPPLRERKEDIPILVQTFLKKNSSGKNDLKIDKRAMKILETYDWPGNIRELNNVIERAVIMSDGDCIRRENLPLGILRKN
ncbi:MAG TPA: sigma 54-interacting transcriptional regulator, partial [Clostridiales bacterium]|nr:sigma 54-interacting transcriptional regulator [Clostridiales bacterium]